MATIEQMQQALIAADKAGDTQAATAIAQALKQAQASAGPPAPIPGVGGMAGVMLQPATGGPLPPANGQGRGANFPPWNPSFGSLAGLLPISGDQTGVHFDPKAGIMGAMLSGATLPGDVAYGTADPNSPPGMNRRIPVGMNEQIDRAAQMGLLLSPSSPVAPRTVTIPESLNVMASKPPVPTSDALRGAAKTGYTAADKMGVVYSAPSVVHAMDETQAILEGKRFRDTNAPDTFTVLRGLQSPAAGAEASYTDLASARSTLGQIGREKPGSPDAAAAAQVIAAINAFIQNPPPSSVVAGPAAAIAKIDREADANYSAAKRSETLQGVEYNAGVRTFKSGNTADAIRSRVATILSNDKLRAQFSKDDIAALELVNSGTASVKTLDKVGRLVGLVTTVGGAILGNDVLPGDVGIGLGAAAGSAVSPAAKVVKNWLVGKSLNAADEATRARAPLYGDMLSSPPPTTIGTSGAFNAPRAFIAGELSNVEARKRRAMADALLNHSTTY